MTISFGATVLAKEFGLSSVLLAILHALLPITTLVPSFTIWHLSVIPILLITLERERQT